MNRLICCSRLFLTVFLLATVGRLAEANDPTTDRQRFLYVATPGVRDDLKLGGHGVLVFDMNHQHKFVKRIRLDEYGLSQKGAVLNVKGICASAKTNRLYVSTLEQLLCIDLETDKVIWQKSFDLGCDRMSITPDGKVIYLPSLENKAWYIVDAATGNEITRLVLNSKSHNTIVGLDGKRAYLAGLDSPYLAVASTAMALMTLGPSPAIRLPPKLYRKRFYIVAGKCRISVTSAAPAVDLKLITRATLRVLRSSTAMVTSGRSFGMETCS